VSFKIDRPTNIDWLFAGLIAAALLGSAVLIGVVVSGNGLGDLDTCWLLKTGEQILQSHSLPATDPYSYTFASLNRPFVMHQWLSEIFFYCIYNVAGLAGLLYFCTFCLSTAFVYLPLSVLNGFNRETRNVPLSLVLVAIAPLACISRFLTRPELFSYICLAGWFMMLSALRQNKNNESNPKRIHWFLIAGFAAVMMVWANLHSGFAFGVLLLLYFNIEAVIIFFSSKTKSSPFNLTAPIALVLTACATLVNPYGIKLITYVIGMFTSPSKAYITEMLPIATQNLAKPELWPFLIFLGLAITNVVQVVSEKDQFEEPNQTQKVQRYFSLALIAMTIFLAFSSRRFISFCVLTTLFQLIAINRMNLKRRADGGPIEASNASTESSNESIDSAGVTECLQRLHLHKANVHTLPVAISLITTVILVAGQTLTLPQTTWFVPPFKAFEYLKAHQPSGNVYNDSHFGSMLIWYRPDAPKVFIDTRFDIYESVFLRNFGEALFGNHYEELFDRYKISWVFLKPAVPLVEILSRDPKWETCYRDDVSVIMKRVEPAKQK